ncbi:hypothetical protein J437_LFUL016625 [Ladona fulva]|uniref:Uncharacterized protein n=1 Tax=Ladona fulva TaxID=123851 RepID=A0A8K0PAQ1_LADFU|nr:hypothetical protein J437_LFUL016625 [Ladona fulva]
MCPLGTFYEQEVRQWLIAHPGRAVTINQVGKLMNSLESIFPEHLYAPSDTTDRPEAASEPQPYPCGPILQQEGAAESQRSTSRNTSGFSSPASGEQSTFTISSKILMPPAKKIERT